MTSRAKTLGQDPTKTHDINKNKDNNIINNKNRQPKMNEAPTTEDQFTQFWNVYPKKMSKTPALKAFTKIMKQKNSPELKSLISTVETWSKTKDWKKDDGQYIPHAATWLNQRRWEDELPGPQQIVHKKKTELEELMGM